MRPELTKFLHVHDFQSHYWLKEELQIFCRKNGIRAYGSKAEITNRMAIFLETGKIEEPIQRKSSVQKKVKQEDLSLDTIISENHRCSQVVRAFFQSIIPTFHFSTYI